MTTFTLYLDSTTQTSSTAVVGPSGPSGSFSEDDDYTASNGAVIDAAAGDYTITLPSTASTVTVRDVDGEWSSGGPTVDLNGATFDGEDTFDLTDWQGFAVTFIRKADDTVILQYSYLDGTE